MKNRQPARSRVYKAEYPAQRRKQTQEQLRLRQLLASVCIFLAVFIGKGVHPEKILEVRDDLLGIITQNTDFRGAFTRLGVSISEGPYHAAWLGHFAQEVFGLSNPERSDNSDVKASVEPQNRTLSLQATDPFDPLVPRDQDDRIYYYLYAQPRLEWSSEQTEMKTEQNEVEAAAPAEVQAVPAVGTVLETAAYSGPEIPARYTLDRLSLGDLETTEPVFGALNSGYGYRNHPIDGTYEFHSGVDIGGRMGDPIVSFADGVIDYIGEDNSYGLYLQVDHGNGIKSFYAHCSDITVRKGQTVSLGETIAQVGSSGNSTGPHLHLEIKWNGKNLNPAHYITFREG